MESVMITFNYDPKLLKEAGIDPSTSEGKARLRELFLDAMGFACEDPWREKDLKAREAFLHEE